MYDEQVANAVAISIGTMLWSLRPALEQCVNTPKDEKTLETLLTGFCANAVLQLYERHHHRRFSYQQIMQLANGSWILDKGTGKLVPDNPNPKKVTQVNEDEAIYRKCLHDYSNPGKRVHGLEQVAVLGFGRVWIDDKKAPFEAIAEYLLQKIEGSFKSGYDTARLSLLLENEYNLASAQVLKSNINSLKIFIERLKASKAPESLIWLLIPILAIIRASG